MKTVAIIPAGGAGRRMGTDIAKQYLLLDGTPILIHTLKVFQDTPFIDDVILTVPAGDIRSVGKKVWEEYGLSKVRTVLPGGKERQDSVKNGLDAVREDYDIVIIHDAVRCFISEEMIHASIAGAFKYGAAVMGMPIQDTIKKISADGFIDKTVARHGLWQTQTPQAFQTAVIKRAYEAAYRDQFYGTDDAQLVERLGMPVMMLQGACHNIKITTKEDMSLGHMLINNLR
ncbi:MAG: 2-C-methyl-D-erythritol 4-phosphate cytidylyltransferase [Deltaproteobacteria bacterium]|nr:2-C-methyl-D-erythritol 4-phosphate cytidylyltransferase [Deltaproteobacteria bacterium]